MIIKLFRIEIYEPAWVIILRMLFCRIFIKQKLREETRVNMINIYNKVCFLCLQLTAVNSVVFTLKAVDKDGDMISYIIDQSSVRWSTSLSIYFCPCPVYVFMNSSVTCFLFPAAWRGVFQDRSTKQWESSSEQTSGLRDQNSAAGDHLGPGNAQSHVLIINEDDRTHLQVVVVFYCNYINTNNCWVVEFNEARMFQQQLSTLRWGRKLFKTLFKTQ